MAALGQPGVAPSRAETSGRATMATTALTGTSSSTVQVSSAAEVCRTWPRSARLRTLAGPGQHRHHHGGERPAQDDVVDNVRHHVGGGVGGPQALRLHRVREHHLPAEADHPREHGDRADQQRRPAYSPGPSPSISPARLPGQSLALAGWVGIFVRTGRGASSSDSIGSRRWRRDRARSAPDPRGAGPACPASARPGVRSITLVKLTFSLAAVSPVIPASSAIRAVRGSPAAAAPSMAPSAFAPQSPSMARSPRSSGSRARAAASGAATPGAAAAQCAARGDQRAGGDGDLDRPPRPQVEQVEQVGPAGHQARR